MACKCKHVAWVLGVLQVDGKQAEKGQASETENSQQEALK
jgi:hypothetical protein